MTAQRSTFSTALDELKVGRKRSHWMWFIFPQLRGLGRSATAEFYGISSLDETRAYLAHPVLGPRLILCTETALAVEGRSVHAIFGSPDDLKFCSSMTLFALGGRGRERIPACPRPLLRRLLGRADGGVVRSGCGIGSPDGCDRDHSGIRLAACAHRGVGGFQAADEPSWSNAFFVGVVRRPVVARSGR